VEPFLKGRQIDWNNKNCIENIPHCIKKFALVKYNYTRRWTVMDRQTLVTGMPQCETKYNFERFNLLTYLCRTTNNTWLRTMSACLCLEHVASNLWPLSSSWLYLLLLTPFSGRISFGEPSSQIRESFTGNNFNIR
jgi:hypothetical protein